MYVKRLSWLLWVSLSAASASCSFLVVGSFATRCGENEPAPRCEGNVLITCSAEESLEIRQPCGADEVCDAELAACVREGGSSRFGEACLGAEECSTNLCATEELSGSPGGYCTQFCSNPGDFCDLEETALCITLTSPQEATFCAVLCEGDGSCRPGYACTPAQDGLSVCLPHCTDDDQCSQTGNCNLDNGLCSASREICDDKQDNDGDGFIDCSDRNCANVPNCAGVCGDGVAQGNEECDGTDVRGQKCESFGFDTGLLSCNADCTFDTSGCFDLGPENNDEACSDGVDNDGDGLTDCDEFDCNALGACPNCDRDNDGFRDVLCGGNDCDDLNSSIRPNAAEICQNGLDDNCDTLTDEEPCLQAKQ